MLWRVLARPTNLLCMASGLLWMASHAANRWVQRVGGVVFFFRLEFRFDFIFSVYSAGCVRGRDGVTERGCVWRGLCWFCYAGARAARGPRGVVSDTVIGSRSKAINYAHDGDKSYFLVVIDNRLVYNGSRSFKKNHRGRSRTHAAIGRTRIASSWGLASWLCVFGEASRLNQRRGISRGTLLKRGRCVGTASQGLQYFKPLKQMQLTQATPYHARS
jgi:hypothetical protein